MEMAVMPSVLFLDEPTSGLDSLASLSLMELVKNKIANSFGITAFAVLHQPRIEIS
jgi:ABC-type multidrug transport system ATPase subunit